MALRTYHLKSGNYAQAGVLEYGTIYFNTNTRLWYSDAECQHEITQITIPHYPQRKFVLFRGSSSSTSTTYIDGNGRIVYTPTVTTTSDGDLYGVFDQISIRYFFTPAEGVYASVTEFFRSVTPNTPCYADDKLTFGPVTSIPPPYKSGAAFAGVYAIDEYGNRTYRIDENGNFVQGGYIYTKNTTTDFDMSSQVRLRTCYKATLNANGGTGGEVNPIWYNRIQGWWGQDDTMRERRERVVLPKQSGKIFTGYYTTSSGGTKTINADGTFTLVSPPTSSNVTYYAHWTNPVTITLNKGSGSSPLSKIYYGGGAWFDNATLETPVTQIAVPTWANHRFLGYYNGSTRVIGPDGTISSSYAPSAAATLTAQYELVSYTITINANGGTGTTAIYANAARSAVYADEMCEGDPITSIAQLIRPGYRFLGVYTADDVSSTKLIDSDGSFTASMASFVAALTGNVTTYAKWQQVFTIEVDAAGGTGTQAVIYYDDAYGLFYDDPAMVEPITRLVVPTKECHRFDGFYTAATGGTQVVGADGSISGSWTPTASGTIYAHWTRISWKCTLDTDGGETELAAIYNDGSDGSAWYADDLLTQRVTNIGTTVRPGYTFDGFWCGTVPAVDNEGLVILTDALSGDITATARWTANTYTLYFDYNGGTGTVQSKQVTFGQPIGDLPSATRSRAAFRGWMVGTQEVSSSTPYSVPGNGTALAQWELQFGGVTDWFNLGSQSLVPVSSDSGDNRQRICVSHTGRTDASETGGVWRNPSVTYQVVRNMTLNVTLGAAYGGGNGISGYMITGVKVSTAVGKYPMVTVTATANEGRAAINQFGFYVSLLGRARAQNLLNAVSGGGQLQSCSLQATCTPVVIAENNMPCSSDVVGGKIIAQATTYAPNTENAPTAGGGFTEVGVPKKCGAKNYLAWQLKAERDM